MISIDVADLPNLPEDEDFDRDYPNASELIATLDEYGFDVCLNDESILDYLSEKDIICVEKALKHDFEKQIEDNRNDVF